MKSLFTFPLPLAVATDRITAVPSSAPAQAVILTLKAEPAAKHAYKSREFLSQSAHRAQMLASRRATIRTSAKRW